MLLMDGGVAQEREKILIAREGVLSDVCIYSNGRVYRSPFSFSFVVVSAVYLSFQVVLARQLFFYIDI